MLEACDQKREQIYHTAMAKRTRFSSGHVVVDDNLMPESITYMLIMQLIDSLNISDTLARYAVCNI